MSDKSNNVVRQGIHKFVALQTKNDAYIAGLQIREIVKTSAASVCAIITEKTSSLKSAILSEISLPDNIHDYATRIRN